MPFLPTTIKSRGYFAESRPDGRWNLKGRGQRRTVTFTELQAIFNPPPRKRPEAASK